MHLGHLLSHIDQVILSHIHILFADLNVGKIDSRVHGLHSLASLATSHLRALPILIILILSHSYHIQHALSPQRLESIGKQFTADTLGRLLLLLGHRGCLISLGFALGLG
jgi:hypothetical protein